MTELRAAKIHPLDFNNFFKRIIAVSVSSSSSYRLCSCIIHCFQFSNFSESFSPLLNGMVFVDLCESKAFAYLWIIRKGCAFIQLSVNCLSSAMTPASVFFVIANNDSLWKARASTNKAPCLSNVHSWRNKGQDKRNIIFSSQNVTLTLALFRLVLDFYTELYSLSVEPLINTFL